jgi:hypothetical protein
MENVAGAAAQPPQVSGAKRAAPSPAAAPRVPASFGGGGGGFSLIDAVSVKRAKK